MKNLGLKMILPIAFGVVLFTSCNKEECHECHYDKDGAEIELGEKCGSELENLEASGFNEGGINYTVHCHEH